MAPQTQAVSKPQDEQARFDANMAELQAQSQQIQDARAAQAAQPLAPAATAPTEPTDATTPPPDAPQFTEGAQASPTGGPQDWRARMQTAVVSGMKKGVEVDKGIVGGVARIPGYTLGGVLDAASDVSSAIANAIPGKAAAQKAVGANPISAALALGGPSIDHVSYGSNADLLSMRDTLGKFGNENVNQATAVMGSLVVGTEGVLASRVLSWAPRIIANTLAFAGATGVIASPDEERFSNALQSLGLHTEFTDWLAAHPDHEPALEARFKNSVDAIMPGALAESFFRTAKWVYKVAKGVAPEAQAAAHQAAQEATLKVAPGLAPAEAKISVASTAEAPTHDVTLASPIADHTPESFRNTRPQQEPNVLAARKLPQEPTSDDVTVSVDTGAAEGPRPVYTSPRSDFESFADEVRIQRNRAAIDRGLMDLTEAGDQTAQREVGQWKISQLGQPDNVSAVLRAVVDRVAADESQATVRSADEVSNLRPRSDADLMATAREAADRMGQDPTAILAEAQRIAGNTRDLDTSIKAMQTMWTRIAQSVDQLTSRDIPNLTDEELKDGLAQVHNVITFASHFMDVKTGLGRGLRAIRLPDADTYMAHFDHGQIPKEPPPGEPLNGGNLPRSGDSTSAMQPLPRNRTELRDWLELWGTTGQSPAARLANLEDSIRLPSAYRYLRTSVANLFTANVLSGVPSVLMNVAGPALVSILRTVEQTTGGFMASLLAPTVARFAGSADRAGLLATARYSSQAYFQTFLDAGDILHFAAQAARNNSSVLGGGRSTYDVASSIGPITDGMLRAAGGGSGPNFLYTLGNAINLWPRAFQKINGGLDELSNRATYLGGERLKALNEAASQGLSGQAAKDFIRDRLRNSIDAYGAATDAEGLREAQRTTMTGPVGKEGGWARKASNFVAYSRKAAPELRFIIPVFNVPANTLGETLRRVPFLNMTFQENREELLGAHGAIRQAEAYGRMMTGAAMLITGFGLSRAGIITGPGPTNAADRKIWLEKYQPYSIRIGEHWVSYARYDPISGLLGGMATLYDHTVNRPQDKPYGDMIMAGVSAIAQFLKDKASLQGMAAVFNFGADPQHSESILTRLEGTVAARLLVPNFVTQLGRNMADDLQRVKHGWADYVIDAMPWDSQELDPVRNTLGEPLHKPQDSLAENILPLTIAPVVSWERDPVIDEQSRLYEITGYAGGAATQTELSHGAFDATQLKLEDGRSLMDAWVAARMNSMDSLDGMNVRQALQELFSSDDYKDAVDGDASGGKTIDGDRTRGSLVAEVFAKANKEAKQMVAQKSPIAARYLAVAEAKKSNDDRLRAYPAGDLAKNPDLLKSLGIDIQDYEDKVRRGDNAPEQVTSPGISPESLTPNP